MGVADIWAYYTKLSFYPELNKVAHSVSDYEEPCLIYSKALKIEGCKQRIKAPCSQLSVGMGNYIGLGVQNSQSLDPSYSTPNSSCAEPKEGRMDILPCNFYRNQCRVLKKQLSDAEEILNKHTSPAWCDGTDSSAGFSWPQSALLELRQMLKVGESLIEGCHNESCFKAYIRRGERTQAFAETVKEIIWCMSVGFYNGTTSLPKNTSMSMNGFPLPELGAYKELYMMQEAASEDEKDLLNALDVWIERHRCSANECGGPAHQEEDSPICIATQILQRINEGKMKNDIAVIGKSPEADHTSVLWNIDGKILEDGKFIGSGAFCSVIETTWMGETYAKKNFQMENPAVFRNEANVLSKLTHPHMVTVSAYSVSPQVCSLLLERMPHDLRQYMIKRQEEDRINPPFSISAAFDLMLQVAEAMKYMHSEGMVHRDLKAGNILVRPVDDPELYRQGFVVAKLADFGLAKLKNEVTNYSHLTKNQGTRRWMAPEVFKADADNDERLLVAYPQKTDVYSFGIVCSEILTGKVPFQNVRLSELYELLTDTVNPLRPELPESCPESLAALIQTCWHTDPRERPTFMEICTTLRYTKGLLMLTGDGQWKPWMETRLQSLMTKGPYSLDLMLTGSTEMRLRIPTGDGQLEPWWENKSRSLFPFLYYTTYDGSSWTTAVPLGHEMASPNGMSLANHHGTLVGVHRGLDDDLRSQNLYWNTYTNSSWTPPQVMKSQTSPSRPAVAAFQDRLYCLYRGKGNEIWCTSAGSNLNIWIPPVNVGLAFRTSDGPALARYGDRLICVVRGIDNNVYWDSFSGSRWRGYERVGGLSTSGSPAVAVYKNELYCCVRGMGADAGWLFWEKLSSNMKWSSFHSGFEVGLNRSGPSLAVFNDQLVCTLIGPGHQVQYSTFNGLRWSEVSAIPSQYSLGEQGLCAIHSRLFCVYGIP